MMPRDLRSPGLRRLVPVLAFAAAWLVGACSADSERLRSLRAPLRHCEAGTFIGSMTANCPQPVR